MGSAPRFDLDEARRLYEAGLSCRQIGKQLNVSFSRVASRLRRCGTTMRADGRHLTEASAAIDVGELYELRKGGATFPQLAERYGVSVSVARDRYLKARAQLD